MISLARIDFFLITASSNSFQNKGLHDAEIERKNSKERVSDKSYLSE